VCHGLRHGLEATNKHNPCILAGFPVSHSYEPEEIISAFRTLFGDSTRNYCQRHKNFTAMLLSEMSIEDIPGLRISWENNYKYFFGFY